MKYLVIFLIIIFSACRNQAETSVDEVTIEENQEVYSDELGNDAIVYENAYEPVQYSETTNNELLEKKDCSDAESSGDDAYTYCQRAYNSDDYEEVKSYLKKAMDSFEEAISSAEECKCDDSEYSADEGYTYAKRGYNSDDFEEMKDYARKAKNSADDTMSSADDCMNE